MPRKPTRSSDPLETIIADPDSLSDCLQHLAAQTHIAFDTEFVGEETYRPDLCLVQVATAEQLFLIDPLSTGPLDAFWELLADPKRMVIVHAGREEMRMCNHGIGRPPANVFDVQIAAGLLGFTYPIGYAGLVQELLNVRLQKSQTLTDWRRRPLTPDQQSYAYDDVRFLIPIWRKIQDGLQRLNREAWAAEEFANFVRRSVIDDPAVEKWRKIKGIGNLDGRGLAVARELFHWRARSILRDELLSDLARRPPQRLEELQAFRGVSKSDIPHIFEAIRLARSLQRNEWPAAEERDNDQPHINLLSNLLNVVLTEWCARNKIAAALVTTTSELKQLIRARQPGGAVATNLSLSTGWRERVILPELLAFLDGKRSLFVADPAAIHPIRVAPTVPTRPD
jgi:ribonuclease D